MLQDILTWIIIAVCVVIAITMLVRRFRGKGKSCGCGCGGSGSSKTDDSCRPSEDGCTGCAIADLCNSPEKK